MLLLRALLLAALALGGGGAAAQVSEQQVKAAFLYRFLSFVEWPGEALGAADQPLVIAVAGADDLLTELDGLVAGRRVNDRPIVVQRLRDDERPTKAHLVFVGRGARAQLKRLAGRPAVLVVAETPGALDDGAVINFVVPDDRVRFEVAPDEAERLGLRISARMLALAIQVKPGRARP